MMFFCVCFVLKSGRILSVTSIHSDDNYGVGDCCATPLDCAVKTLNWFVVQKSLETTAIVNTVG